MDTITYYWLTTDDGGTRSYEMYGEQGRGGVSRPRPPRPRH